MTPFASRGRSVVITSCIRVPTCWRCLLTMLCCLLLTVFALPATAQEAGSGSPQRIVSLGPLATENIFLLGAGERIVGCTIYCLRPREAQQKEKIGTILQLDVEKILALQPDLIIATGLTQPQQVEQFKRLGIPVVHFHQPKSFDEICDQFLRLGALLGLEDRAQQIISAARAKVERIRQQTADLPRQKVFFQVGAQPLFASVANSFTNDYMVLAGAENIAANESRGEYDYEKVLAKDPDTILVAIMGSETGAGAQEKKKWLGFQMLSAVKNKRVHILDPDLVCSPSPASFIEALEQIVQLIHPGFQPKG